MPGLADYYFIHDEMFVIPIEHLSPAGMNAEFQNHLHQRVALPSGWMELFNASFALYWQRGVELAARAPHYWPPPRLQHCCIVTARAQVRPYFQPFNQCSWLLYDCDFDPAVSHVEFATYQFFHMERMALLRDVTETLVRNLSYWVLRNDAEVAAFGAACRTTPRPDAAGFRALADALVWIRRLHHESLNPPAPVSVETPLPVPHTGLALPRGQQPQLERLLRRWNSAAQSALDAFHAVHARRGRDQAGDLCAWLRAAVPQVLVTGANGRLLWDPDTPEHTADVRRYLGGIGAATAASLRADIEVIDAHSRRFLGSLRYADALPLPHADTAQNGLSYMHRTRRCIAYNLSEAGMERLRVPAPPYERCMLGARTIHEWGHLAADAGWIPVPPERCNDHERLVAALIERFDSICRDAPAPVRRFADAELMRLTAEHGGAGVGLARIPLARMSDFQANLLARSYLNIDERETYIRNNVYNLSATLQPTGLFQRLARYAYEYQYLRLSQIADPWRYFTSSTWFVEEYMAPKVLREQDAQALFQLVGGLCDLYEVDRTKFRS